ncbi:MAG: M23 family metallopeptidase [Anaerolineales bacterium]
MPTSRRPPGASFLWGWGLFPGLFLLLTACATRTPPQTVIVLSADSIPPTTPPPGVHAATPSATLRPTLTALPSPTPPPSLTVIPTPTPRHPYVFPVQPPRNAQFGPGGHPYPATDIFTAAGSKFVAVTDGVVEYVSPEDLWQPDNDLPSLRGGISVSIVGVDGWRYYGSHLQAIADGIAPGISVQAGQVLGYVGSSGNARGKDPHLHFGISYPNSPHRIGEIDPYPCLLSWKEGARCQPQSP